MRGSTGGGGVEGTEEEETLLPPLVSDSVLHAAMDTRIALLLLRGGASDTVSRLYVVFLGCTCPWLVPPNVGSSISFWDGGKARSVVRLLGPPIGALDVGCIGGISLAERRFCTRVWGCLFCGLACFGLVGLAGNSLNSVWRVASCFPCQAAVFWLRLLGQASRGFHHTNRDL